MFKKQYGLIYALVDVRKDRICYVGKAVDPASRRSGHMTALCRGNHCNPRLQNIFRKIIAESEHELGWLPLEWAPKTLLADLEVAWIKRLRALGYDLCNATDGGEGTLGRKVSAATRAKISAANCGQKPTELCIARARAVNHARIHTPEERRRRGDALRGNTHGVKNLLAWNAHVKKHGLSESHKANLTKAKRNGGVARGSKQHSAKLTEEQVAEIRSLYASGFGSRRIGRMFGLSPQAAWCIKTRRTWAHVA